MATASTIQKIVAHRMSRISEVNCWFRRQSARPCRCGFPEPKNDGAIFIEIRRSMSTDQHPSRNTKQSKRPERETVANLRSLIHGLESKSIFVNHTPRDRKERVLKIREEIARITRKEARALCNCQQITVAYSRFWEEFAAKMSIPCPIHGPCRLGVIVSFMGYPNNRPCDRRLAELLREYHRRCFTYRNPEV